MARTTVVGLGLVGVITCLVGVPAGFAGERIAGMVTKTHLTACAVVPDKVGTCEGTLELEPQVGERVILQVTRDTVLKRGEEKAFLFQLQGSRATVAYVTEGDQKLATSVVATPSGR